MIDVRIGIETRTLRLPLRKALAAAGRIGAEGVQIDLRAELPLADCSASAIREVKKLLADQRLAVASVAYPTRRGFSDPEQLEQRVAATRQAMDIGAKLGARTLVSPLGPLPPMGSEDPATPLLETLTALAAHGDRVGAQLACSNGGADAQELVALLAKLAPQPIGVDFHPAAIVHAGGSPLEALRLLGPHVAHVTAADAVHDFSQRRVVDVALGRGVVEFPELLATLEGFEYRGWITVQQRGAANPEAELSNAVAYLHAVRSGQ